HRRLAEVVELIEPAHIGIPGNAQPAAQAGVVKGQLQFVGRKGANPVPGPGPAQLTEPMPQASWDVTIVNASLNVQYCQKVTDALTWPATSKKLPFTMGLANAHTPWNPSIQSAADDNGVDPAAAMMNCPVQAGDCRLSAVRAEHLA